MNQLTFEEILVSLEAQGLDSTSQRLRELWVEKNTTPTVPIRCNSTRLETVGEVMVLSPGGSLARGRWDGRSRVWQGWFPFPKRRRPDGDRTEKEVEIKWKDWQ